MNRRPNMNAKMYLWWMTASFAVLVGGMVNEAGFAQERGTTAAEYVNRRMVKLFGSGGYKGLPAYGSGMLVSATGHILTVNNHILNTNDLRIHLADGRRLRGRVISKEPELDVALIKITEEVEGLPHFDFAAAVKRKPLEVGDWVLAFSNQFEIATGDEPMTIQHGTVSAYTSLRGRRGVFDAPFMGKAYFLDQVICNPGSAGGVLTDYKGQLVGIVGREFKNRNTDTWINYAVPIHAIAKVFRKKKGEKEAKEVEVSMSEFVKLAIAGKYKEGRKRTRKKRGGGYTGITLVPNVVEVTPPYVDRVQDNSPAAKAGLRPDDRIVYVDGELIQTIQEYWKMLDSYAPGEEITFDVQRGSGLVRATFKLEKLPQVK
ncbi:MAG: S1C family serine protease [Gemmataceae bacterium]